MTDPSKRKTGARLALAALFIGIVYVGAGLWALTRASSARPAADTPTANPPTATPTLPAAPTRDRCIVLSITHISIVVEKCGRMISSRD